MDLGGVFGRVWGALMATFLDFFSTFSGFAAISPNKLIFDALGRGLGRVLGGSGEGFGKVLEALGTSWALLGVPKAVLCRFS